MENRNSSGAWVKKSFLQEQCQELVDVILDVRKWKEQEVLKNYLATENKFRRFIPFLKPLTLEQVTFDDMSWSISECIEFGAAQWYADNQLTKAKEILSLCSVAIEDQIWLSAEDSRILFG
jgi:hypothetical protein